MTTKGKSEHSLGAEKTQVNLQQRQEESRLIAEEKAYRAIRLILSIICKWDYIMMEIFVKGEDNHDLTSVESEVEKAVNWLSKRK